VNRRKLIGVVASVLVAAVGIFVIMKGSKSSNPTPAASQEQLVSVLKVVKPIPKGTAAAQLGDAVAVQQVPVSQKAEGSAESPADLTGLVASADLLVGEDVMKARFVTAQEQQRASDKSSGGAGLMGLWISLDPLHAMGGRIAAGDQVAVITSFVNVPSNGGNAEGAVPATAIMLHKVPVLEVVGGIAPPAPAGDAATPTTVAPIGNLLIKFGVTAGEAERLVFALNNGTIWLASESTDVPEVDTKVVVRDNVYDPTLRREEIAPVSTIPGSDGPLNADPFATPTTAPATNAAAAGTPAAGATPTTKATAPAAGAPTTKPAAVATAPAPVVAPAALPLKAAS
jgi:pilus assembly protein CpaB